MQKQTDKILVRERNKKKQQELVNAGHKEIKIDGSWGPYLQKLYEQLHSKSFLSKATDWFRNAAATTAYMENPSVMTASGWTILPNGTVKQDSFNTSERNKLSDNLTAIGSAPMLVNSVIFSPLTFLGSMAGGAIVDGASIAATGNTIGENINQATNGVVPVFVGEMANPGYWLGPKTFGYTYNQSLRLPWMQQLVGKLGNNIKVDAFGRLLNLTKPLLSNIPSMEGLYFIRNTGAIPTVENGKVFLSPLTQAFVNTTLGKPFDTHSRYKYRPGTEYFVIDKRAFEGLRPLSTQLGDTFFENLPIDLKYLTIVTGNPELLELARSRGFNTITSEAILDLYKASVDSYQAREKVGRFLLGKGMRAEVNWGPYNDAITNLIRSRFGVLTPELVTALELLTGLKSNFSTRFGLLVYPRSSPREHLLAKLFGFQPHPSRGTVNYTLIADELGVMPIDNSRLYDAKTVLYTPGNTQLGRFKN